MLISSAEFQVNDQVIYTPALPGKMPQLARVENVLDGKYGIRTETNEFSVVKAERLTPANPAVPVSVIDDAPAPLSSVAPTSFCVGQAVMYDPGTYHHRVKNDPVPATIIKIARQKIRIALENKSESWVNPDKLTPIPAVVSDSPLTEGEGLGVRVEDGLRLVDATHSAITGICNQDDCRCQYDYVFDTAEIDNPQWRDFVYWAALVNPCPVCKLLLTDHDTEELPAVPVAQDEIVCPPDSGEIEVPLIVELADGEHDIDPFDHPAVATRIADLNQRIADLVEAVQWAEGRAEASDAKAEQFQLQVLELVRKIPVPPQPRLDRVDRDRLEFLCQRHLRKSLEDTLDYLRFTDSYPTDYPSYEIMCKAIAQRLVDRSLSVIAHECATEVAKNDTMFISLSFGFNTLALFNDRQGDIEHAFAHTRYHHIMHDWRSTAFAFTFDPPCQITMKRDHKGYPKLFTLFVMEDES